MLLYWDWPCSAMAKFNCSVMPMKWDCTSYANEMRLHLVCQWNETAPLMPMKWECPSYANEMRLHLLCQWNETAPLMPMKWDCTSYANEMRMPLLCQWNENAPLMPMKWDRHCYVIELKLTVIPWNWYWPCCVMEHRLVLLCKGTETDPRFYAYD
jgi:hypothetical protein